MSEEINRPQFDDEAYRALKIELSMYSGGVEISALPVICQRIGVDGTRAIYSRLFDDPEIEIADVYGAISGPMSNVRSSQIVVGTRRDPYRKSIGRHSDEYMLVELNRKRFEENRLEKFVAEGDEK